MGFFEGSILSRLVEGETQMQEGLQQSHKKVFNFQRGKQQT